MNEKVEISIYHDDLNLYALEEIQRKLFQFCDCDGDRGVEVRCDKDSGTIYFTTVR